MARRVAKRYDGESKLNIKKVIAVIVLLIVIVMFVIGIKSLLKSNTETTSGKIETVTYYTVYDNGKWGVINSYGDIVVKPNYDEMIVIPDNTKAVFICTYDANYSEGTYKTKVINHKEKEIIKGYEKIEPILNQDKNKNIIYENNMFKVQKEGKYGITDFSGKEILKCEYEKIEAIQGIENSFIIVKDGKYGLCDNSGNIIIDTKYSRIEKIESNYKNGYIVVDENNNYGIIGFDKSIVLECKYEEVASIYSNNLFVVKQNGKYIVIDKEGKTILENKFDEAKEISGENIVAKKNGKYGVINTNGETKINFEYDNLTYMNTDYYIAQKNEKYGVISINKEEKLPFEYVDINYVSAGDFIIADYMENETLTAKVINSSFETKITGVVSEVNNAKGYIKMIIDEEYKYYNFKFEEKAAASVLTNSTLFVSKKDGKYGFVDADGKVIVDYIYDDATEQNSSGYAGIKKDGVWGSIDIKGNVVANPQYNLDDNDKIDFIGNWHMCEDKNANYYLDV